MKISPITIDLQYEYRVKIEEPKDFRNSLFFNSYIEAYNKLFSTINYNDNKDQNDLGFDNYNNLICFTGERGRGKTSTMISFFNSLKDERLKKQMYDENFLSKDLNDKIFDKKFETLPVIDPSLFRGNETLVEIVLAQMLANFKKILEDSSYSNRNNGLKKDIIKLFQEIYNQIQNLNSKNSSSTSEDTLQVLLDLANSTTIREKFNLLVKSYLDFLGNADYLVIAIDDLDFKVEQTYLMLEDIRQILINDNIIILSTFKVNQLIENLNNYFNKQFKNEKLIEDRTLLYLNKIIPINRCIELDDLGVLLESSKNIIIKNGNKNIYDGKKGFTRGLENIIRQILWNDYKIILPKKDNRSNLIIPKTIRQLLVFFSNTNNREEFINQLINYCSNLINDDAQNQILNSLKLCDSSNLNIKILQIIKDLISIQEFDSKQIDTEKLNLLFNATQNDNISVSDIATLFYLLEISETGKSSPLFVDVIEMLYNLLAIKKGIRYQFLELYNGIIKLNTLDNGFISLKNESISESSRLLLHYVGKYDQKKNYREGFLSPFLSNYSLVNKFAVFTPLSLFGNIMNAHFEFETLKKINKKDFFNIMEIDYVNKSHFVDKRGMEMLHSIYYNPSFVKTLIINYKKVNNDLENYNLKDNNVNKLYFDTTFRVDEALEITYSQLALNIILFQKDFIDYEVLNAKMFYGLLNGIFKSNESLINDLTAMYSSLRSERTIENGLTILNELESFIRLNENSFKFNRYKELNTVKHYLVDRNAIRGVNLLSTLISNLRDELS